VSGLPWVKPISWTDNSMPAFWALLLRSEKRDIIQHMLREEGIETSRIHYPNHFYSCFEVQQSELPQTCQLYKEVFSLPCGWWLSQGEIYKIISTVTKISQAI